VLAARLVTLDRWEEAVAALRELTRLRPEDAGSLLRLGSALLHGLDRPADAVEPLRHAGWLAPADARAHGELALALHQLGELAPALAEYEEALRLDPSYLEARPGARLAFEAAQRGQGWP
jgi:Flp pilus assembly protein TadD